MALGGHQITWNETVPSGTSNVGLGASDLTGIKVSVRSALDSEHIFPTSSGSAGAHRLGSARVFVGTASQISSVDTDGRLMYVPAAGGGSLWYLSSVTTAEINNMPSKGVAGSLSVWTTTSAISSSGLFDLGTPTAGVPYCVVPSRGTWTRAAVFPVNSTTTTVVFDSSTVAGSFAASTTTRVAVPSALTGLYFAQYQGSVDNVGAPTGSAVVNILKNGVSVLSGKHPIDSNIAGPFNGSALVAANSLDTFSITLQNSTSTATFAITLGLAKVW